MLSSETSPNLHGLENPASEIVLRLLGRLGTVGSELRGIVEKGCLRNLDARTIIREDLIGEHGIEESETIARTIEFSRSLGAIENTLGKIEEEGLAPHFRELVSLFGSILLDICGNENQRRRVESWSTQLPHGVFLMTDRGGASLADWLSCFQFEAGSTYLAVNKIDAIDAHMARFAIVAARRGRVPRPSLFLLSPQQLEQLKREPIGQPWLNGAFQLANVEGRVRLDVDSALSSGGFQRGKSVSDDRAPAICQIAYGLFGLA